MTTPYLTRLLTCALLMATTWPLAADPLPGPVDDDSLLLRLVVPADRRWHAVDIPTAPGWTLRAQLPPYDTAGLHLQLLDEKRTVRSDAVVGVASIHGGASASQYRLPTGHADPWSVVLSRVRRGAGLEVGIQDARFAYCGPLTPLADYLEGLAPPPGKSGPDLAQSWLDPVLAVAAHGDRRRLNWGDARFEVVRYLTRSGDDVTRSGYVLVDRLRRRWSTLLSVDEDGLREASGRLFPDGILALSDGQSQELPFLFTLSDEGAVPIPIPRAPIRRVLETAAGGPLEAGMVDLMGVQRRPGALGELLTLELALRRTDGRRRLVRLHLRDGDLLRSAVLPF